MPTEETIMEALIFQQTLTEKIEKITFSKFILVVGIAITGQIVIFLLKTAIGSDNAAQLSLEYLFIFTFVFTLIIAGLRHGKWVLFLFILELLIVIHEETNSLYNLKTYMYTGFSLNLGYQNAIPEKFLPSGGYPIAIAFAWVFLIYACYNFTNIILDGPNKRPQLSFIEIFARIILDGMFLWQFSLLGEAVGVDLGWWIYAPKAQPRFYGAPMDTLYYYLIVGLLFSSLLRLGEKITAYRAPVRNVTNIGWMNGFPCIIFLYFWFFIILLVLVRFGPYHWAFFVGTPTLVIFTAIFLARFIMLKLKFDT